MSEPYSEAPDIETARRLLDFGDDYRNFLDSQSDCASSMSAIAASSPLPRSRMHHVRSIHYSFLIKCPYFFCDTASAISLHTDSPYLI